MKRLTLITTTFLFSTFLLGQEQTKTRKETHLLKQSKISSQTISGKENKQNEEEGSQPVSYQVGRNGVQSTIQEEQKPKEFNAATVERVERQLKDLFGEYYKEYGAPNLEFYTEFYERCEFIPLSETNNAPISTNLSELDVKDKYNPEVIKHDTIETFNADTFNVLKYRLDYYNKADVYYRIYNTDMILKINKQ